MCTGRGRCDSKISHSAGSRISIDSAVIVAMKARWSGRSCSVPWPRPLSRVAVALEITSSGIESW
jgi:hypothetical protein